MAPTADLKAATTYYVTWTADIKGTNGRSIEASNANFTTGDFAKPAVVSSTPANGAADVAKDASVVITFSKAMSDTNFSLGTNVTLQNVTDGNYTTPDISAGWTKSWSDDKKVLTLKPSSATNLVPNKTYKMVIKKAVTDNATIANEMAADYELTFSSATAATAKFVNVKSGANATSDAVVASGVKSTAVTANYFINYDQAISAASLTNVKVQKMNLATGIYADVTTTVGAPNATNPGVIISGSKAIQIAAPTTGGWEEDSTYKVTVQTTVLDAYGNSVQESVFEFTTGPKPTASAPLVTVGTTVDQNANLATGVALTTPVKVTLTDVGSSLSTSSINSDTVFLREKVSGTKVTEATFAYNAGSATTGQATITLNDGYSLTAGTVYTIVVSGVKDAAGNVINDTTWDFTTTTVAADLAVTNSSIPNNTTGVAMDSKVTFTFNETINPDSVKAAAFTLTQSNDISKVVPVTATVTGKLVTVTPVTTDVDWANNTVYTLTIKKYSGAGTNEIFNGSAAGATANGLKSDYVTSFRTVTATAAAAQYVGHGDGATAAGMTTANKETVHEMAANSNPLLVGFSKVINTNGATATLTNMSDTTKTNSIISLSVITDGTNNTIVSAQPLLALISGNTYRLTVTGIVDIDGNTVPDVTVYFIGV